MNIPFLPSHFLIILTISVNLFTFVSCFNCQSHHVHIFRVYAENVYYFIVYVFYRFSVNDTIDRLELMDCLSVIMSVYFSFYLSVSLSLPLLLSLYYKLVTRLKRLWRLLFYLFWILTIRIFLFIICVWNKI